MTLALETIAGTLRGKSRIRNPVPVARQLKTFLERELEQWCPDLIVVGERKGTAVLRALLEGRTESVSWPWQKVISSTALDQLSPDAYKNKRILVFDDMVRTGATALRLLRSLQERFGPLQDGSIRFAFFAVHRDASSNGFLEGPIPCQWFYRDLTTESFHEIRCEIVETLQESGSLMLDTEHIELRLRLNTGFGFKDLVRSLSRMGTPVVFESLARRTNITVYYGDEESHKLPEERFPLGIGFNQIVKKCRVVQRAGDEFAIIPICLPSVPKLDFQWNVSERDSALLGGVNTMSEKARFYAVGLLGSLYPLKWLLRDLFASDPRIFSLSLPSHSSASTGDAGYSLEHLKVMFPSLNLGLLVDEIGDILREEESNGAELRRRKPRLSSPPFWSSGQLFADSLVLLQIINQEVDQRRAESFAVGGTGEESRSGLRAREIFELGQLFRWEPARISALIDILIDDADLVTRVESHQDQAGFWRIARTFKPDGEVVSELIRRYTLLHGFPSITLD